MTLLTAVLLLAAAWAEEPEPPADAPPDDPLATIQGGHGADVPAHVPRAETWDAWGELRGRVLGATDPVLDTEGTRAGRDLWFTSRLVAGFGWKATDRVALELEIEAINGQFAGDTTAVGTGLQDDVFRVSRDDRRDVYRVLPRKALVTALFPKAGQLRVGAQLFTWGTGMLANDGRGDPDFGDPETGSVVARVAFATAPWRNAAHASLAARGTSIFLAGDVVLRDDNASIFDGDLAVAGVLGWRVQHPRVDAGMFGVARWQRDREDPFYPEAERATVLAFPVDAYVKGLLTEPGLSRRVILEAEAAVVPGHTTRPYGEETAEDGAALAGFGAVARVRFDDDRHRLTAKLEGGYASGDDDLRDDVSRTFSFHSDFQVGQILFDQLLPLITARSVDLASDASLVAVPSAGLRFTVNQGTVSNAVYVFPVLRYRPLPPLDLRAGYLAAWSAGNVVDVYQSGIHGGYDRTPGGVQGGSRFYGHEVDLSLRYTLWLPHDLAWEFGAEGAVFLPGGAFDGLGDGGLSTQWLGRGRLAFQW